MELHHERPTEVCRNFLKRFDEGLNGSARTFKRCGLTRAGWGQSMTVSIDAGTKSGTPTQCAPMRLWSERLRYKLKSRRSIPWSNSGNSPVKSKAMTDHSADAKRHTEGGSKLGTGKFKVHSHTEIHRLEDLPSPAFDASPWKSLQFRMPQHDKLLRWSRKRVRRTQPSPRLLQLER
ncbi:hypothetical protein EVAR_21862_1 [Eumeta japonica]|uniref:Uncharacterized protein n=1 Tax=Eumeta variegata TaxID=151549 RepID=A0A4C1V7E8_EUMVA|nr:hypothetical protein EVAR_21862_1 [Eumeta japonica]